MTKARMDWKRMTLELDGHANSAPFGFDIICAAESMLTQALLQTLLDMESEGRLGLEWTGSPEKGFLHVEAAPKEEHRAEVTACFRVAVTGLRMLEENYPQYINLREEGKDGNV